MGRGTGRVHAGAGAIPNLSVVHRAMGRSDPSHVEGAGSSGGATAGK